MKRIDVSDWQSFTIGDLFTVERPISRKQSDYDEGDVPFVASGTFNNGVQLYLQPKFEEDINSGNCITISPVDGYAFYQKNDFLGRGGAGSSIILLYNEHLTENNGRFIATILRHIFSTWSYINMGNTDIVRDEKIKLPVNAQGAPDWKYMDSYMRKMEAAACEALSLFAAAKNTPPTKYDTSGWKKFQIKTLFHKCELDCRKTDFSKALDISTEQTDEFDLPLVNAMHFNNGIMYYGREDDWDFEEMTLDIVSNGAISTGDVFAQPQKTGVLWDAYLIKPYVEVSLWTLQYLAAVVQKCVKDHFGYDNKCTWNKVKEEYISLPVDAKGAPDWQYMEDYMKRAEARAQRTMDCLAM